MRRRPWRRPVLPRGRGFTLVELLIALSLIAIMTVLLFSGLRLGARSWEAVETASERVANLRVARNVIERGLRQTRDAELLVDGISRPLFAGEPQAIEWAAPLSGHASIPGLYILRLTLEDAGEHPRLVLTRWLLHPDVLAGGDDYPPWEPLAEAGSAADAGAFDRDVAAGAYGRTVLLPQVETFELAYFGRLEGEQQGDWFEDWLEQPRLPARVRLQLTTPAQSWPAAVVALPGEPVAAEGLR